MVVPMNCHRCIHVAHETPARVPYTASGTLASLDSTVGTRTPQNGLAR
jgi:hypothetical protein